MLESQEIFGGRMGFVFKYLEVGHFLNQWEDLSFASEF